MKNNKLIVVLLGIIVFVVLSYIFNIGIFKHLTNTQSATPNTNKKLQITASFYPLYFFAGEIGGNMVDVKNITPAGSEPHDYEPTTQDIARIEKSNILILNGNVESWGNKIKENLSGTSVIIVVAGEGLFTQQLTEGGKTSPDPHVWLSPQLSKQEVNQITKGYIKIDPSNNSYYQANQKALDDRLDKLDGEYKQGLSNCKQKDIITSHAAFGYLTVAYGLNQVPISGLSADSEPSSQQLVKVINFAKSNNVKYIFFESLVSPKLSDMIANEVGAKTLVLDPLEGLTDDDIKQGKNYFTIMEDNLKNLKIALQCSN